MSGIRLMATEHKLEQWSSALVAAVVLGDLAACKQFGVTARSLRRWKGLARTDPSFGELFRQKLARADAEHGYSLRGGRGRAACELLDAAAAEIEAVVALAGLPEVRSVNRDHALTEGRRAGLRILHRDGSVTLCEALPANEPDPAAVLGALLFARESVRARSGLPASLVRLCVLASRGAPPPWSRVVASIRVEVIFCDIVEVVRVRRAGAV